ncbi:MAG: hypothetical protein CVU53_04140 [Deltaproteobacteria bacterium HGW-Deltaproteobacteria-11]|nr:MAG: hypothetical protein CVU53_04140 [Deltaproteobacteria bacterium HGW-Deltaproteobacteria-11]
MVAIKIWNSSRSSQIDDLFDTYFYHVTALEMLEQIKRAGLKPDKDGIIYAIATNCEDIVDHYARTRTLGNE